MSAIQSGNQIKITPDQMDGSGRLRVSQITPLTEIRFLHDINGLQVNTAGTGTGAYSSANSHYSMSVTSGQYLVLQSNMYSPYFPGKSQLIEMTFTNFQNEANVVKRIGYFNSSTVAPYTASYDGFYLEADGTTYRVKVDRNGTNILNADRTQWDDKLDGTGASGVTINFANFNIFAADFLWLGGKGVRFGVCVNGSIIWFYHYNHANTYAGVMFLSPNKPLRYEIRSTTGSGSLNAICAQVSSEGAISTVGNPFSINTGTTTVVTNTVGTYYALLGIRLKSTHKDIAVKIDELSVLSNTADNFLFNLYLNPTVAGTFTYNSVNANSACEYAVGVAANTITGGTLLNSRVAQKQVVNTLIYQNARRLGTTIGGVMDTIVIGVIPLTNNMQVYASMDFIEFS